MEMGHYISYILKLITEAYRNNVQQHVGKAARYRSIELHYITCAWKDTQREVTF